jgi:atypical dual specificity phosphatase
MMYYSIISTMKNFIRNILCYVPPKMKYVCSLIYTQTLTSYGIRDAWNKIDDLPLYLGMIPLVYIKDELLSLKIDCVISLVEPFEMEESFAGSPIEHNEWNNNGVRTFAIPTPDYEPLNINTLINTIKIIDDELQNGKTVYIHCKAGVGRSASVVVGYIMKKYKMNVDDAIEYVKKYRSSISLNPKQKETLFEYQKILEL